MLAKSHMATGLISATLFSYTPLYVKALDFAGFGEQREALFIILLLPLFIVGSVFPDIDEPRSFIGKKFPIISTIASKTFSHRGFTHFLIFPLLIVICGIFFMFFNHLAALCLFAFACGIFIHQCGDMLTISGIPQYFFPFSRKVAVLLPRQMRFRTGSVKEKALLYGILTPSIALLGMDKFDMYGSVDVEKIIKVIGDFV